MGWQPFDNGATIGQRGSEGGVILRDEEHELGARITLERDCSHGVPFAVTCGIYRWFFHTRFLGSEVEAAFPAMLDGLAAILDSILLVDDPETKEKHESGQRGHPSVRGPFSVRWSGGLAGAGNVSETFTRLTPSPVGSPKLLPMRRDLRADSFTTPTALPAPATSVEAKRG
jgi:hypothetical protein